MKFTKMQGIGNDYVYINKMEEHIDDEVSLAKYVSDRHYGIGSDGLILIDKSDIADFKMAIYNTDGSEAEMCGNGIRCVGKYVYDKHLTDKEEITIETKAGIKTLQLNIEDGVVKTVRVDMGEPILDPKLIPVKGDTTPLTDLKIKEQDREFIFTCVSMGNPHAITFVDDVDNFDVLKYGKGIESNPLFPNRTNVEFISVKDEGHIDMRVFERGVGETMACGTGACASVVASIINNYTKRKVEVTLLGGSLDIEWNEADNHVYMTGPAVITFEGTLML